MWKIYVILALWSHPLSAQYAAQLENSRGRVGERGRERDTNSLKTANNYLDFNSNLPLSAANNYTIVNLPDRTYSYNKNSRDSFGYTDTLLENQLLSRGEESRHKKPQNNEIANTANSLSTTSAILNVDSTTKSSKTWEVQKSSSFDARLFNVMSGRAQHENLAYSPIALQTLLAFIFTISDGKLFEELAQLLAISGDRTYVAKFFENILQKSSTEAQPTMLIMANKLYYDYRFGLVDERVRNFAKKAFDSEMEQVNFFESKKAANSINSWVSNKTHNLIKEIVTYSSISEETNALLVNSIYFKSEWLTKFSPDDTEKQEFFLSQGTKIPVDMMYNEDVFRYGDFPDDLRATVVELPYKNSNLSMLLILPRDIEGLSNLENKLRYYNFNTISQKLKRHIVTVKLPKFQIEYEANMMPVLQQMGLHALFNDAGVISLFTNPGKSLKVDQFKHKSFINVNEAGTEAAATTVAKYVPLSLPTDMKYFVADHPFVFVIRNMNTTFFVGHVVSF